MGSRLLHLNNKDKSPPPTWAISIMKKRLFIHVALANELSFISIYLPVRVKLRFSFSFSFEVIISALPLMKTIKARMMSKL